jgi:hypothetical protein
VQSVPGGSFDQYEIIGTDNVNTALSLILGNS